MPRLRYKIPYLDKKRKIHDHIDLYVKTSINSFLYLFLSINEKKDKSIRIFENKYKFPFYTVFSV